MKVSVTFSTDWGVVLFSVSGSTILALNASISSFPFPEKPLSSYL